MKISIPRPSTEPHGPLMVFLRFFRLFQRGRSFQLGPQDSSSPVCLPQKKPVPGGEFWPPRSVPVTEVRILSSELLCPARRPHPHTSSCSMRLLMSWPRLSPAVKMWVFSTPRGTQRVPNCPPGEGGWCTFLSLLIGTHSFCLSAILGISRL